MQQTQETMMACRLHAIGDLRYEQTAMPRCGAGEVLLKIKNCGVCGSDVGRVLVHGTYHFPTTPGHEFSGVVVEDADGEWTGKRVAVFPILPCFSCDMCRENRFAQCRNYNYYGSRCDGGFAEYIAVKKWNLIELPAGVSFEEGAVCEPLSVALHAVKPLQVQGKTLLITGAGAIGLMAGMWARSFGAERVRYIDIDRSKIRFAESLGFEEYTDGQAVDAVLEGTGASSALAAAIKAAAPFGRLVLMGNPAGSVSLSDTDYQTILRKELRVKGTWNSAFGDGSGEWQQSLDALAGGKINVRKLITHRVALHDTLSAIQRMRDRKEFCCKVVVENEK